MPSGFYLRAMKTLMPVFLLMVLVSCKSPDKDSVTKAELENKEPARTQLISPQASQFLVEMADARMMDFAEGQLAVERGTKKSVRAYGKLMMDDQTSLLNEIRSLAQEAKIVLPAQIGEDKQDGLNDLKKLKGRKFDKKFLTMIQRDHERDVREFSDLKTQTEASVDPKVAKFAQERLPMIQSHLDEVKKIQKSYK